MKALKQIVPVLAILTALALGAAPAAAQARHYFIQFAGHLDHDARELSGSLRRYTNMIKAGRSARSLDEIHYIVQAMSQVSNILSVDGSHKASMHACYYLVCYDVTSVFQLLKLFCFCLHVFVVVKKVNQLLCGNDQISRLLFEQVVEFHISRD